MNKNKIRKGTRLVVSARREGDGSEIRLRLILDASRKPDVEELAAIGTVATMLGAGVRVARYFGVDEEFGGFPAKAFASRCEALVFRAFKKIEKIEKIEEGKEAARE